MTEVTSGVIARVKHVRAARMCMKGMRAWFLHHGLPLDEFRTNGLPVEVLERTGDEMALRVGRVAREDHGC